MFRAAGSYGQNILTIPKIFVSFLLNICDKLITLCIVIIDYSSVVPPDLQYNHLLYTVLLNKQIIR